MFVVLKFGGTSVSTRERWAEIGRQIEARRAEGLTPVVVCSALSGVSNALEALLDTARTGDPQPALRQLRERHEAFAAQLDVDPADLHDELQALERLAIGANLLGEASARVRARVMARGELLATRLGAAWLTQRGIPVTWLDARDLLTSDGRGPDARRYLNAHVEAGPDPALQEQLGAHEVVLTQGFIARDPAGDTVLLGRGGSDTSAAVLAARLGAKRCEIWTDVPGMFTADPRTVPSARLLRSLAYDEAQEIATTGAKVLHPRALAPVREARIPLHIRCTPHPDLQGTRITPRAVGQGAQVKALSARKGLVLVSMETVGMWQQVGFLAQAFGVFARHGLSVDTVSTSETSVTVTLDPTANTLDQAVLDAVLAELSPICQASTVTGAASVSLVGRGIRAILHRLAPVLELFEEHRVHLVSQAASDLNLTFVVDEDQAARVVSRLHAQLFAHRTEDDLLGPTWQALFGKKEGVGPQGGRGSSLPSTAWWHDRRDELLHEADQGTPAYVYDGPTLDARAGALQSLESVDRVLFAMKANPHPDVLRRLAAAGTGFECVSPGELERVREVTGQPATLFTPNFAPRSEYEAGLASGARVTLDNLHPLEHWPSTFAGAEVFVRLDPGTGRGHHSKVRTAGSRSKFGVAAGQLDRLAALAEAAGCRIVGLHAHAGSGVLESGAWLDTALYLADAASRFPDVRVLDLGGGLGVPERPGQESLDLAAVDASLARFRQASPDFELWLEPGRFLVAEAGVLLARVTQLKRKGDVRYIGVDAGMHTLLRPALYGAWHHVVNLTRLHEPAAVTATVVGPICETGDVLARDRRLPETHEGDVLLIATAGAYGKAMASSYNLRRPARETVLDRDPPPAG